MILKLLKKVHFSILSVYTIASTFRLTYGDENIDLCSKSTSYFSYYHFNIIIINTVGTYNTTQI